MLKYSLGTIRYLYLLATSFTGLLIPHAWNQVKNLSSPWLQRGAHSRTTERNLQSSSAWGTWWILISQTFCWTIQLGLTCTRKRKLNPISYLFLEVAAFSCAAKCHLQGHYEFAEKKKNPLGDEGAHGMGNLQLLKAPSVSNGLVFLREGVDGAPVAAEEFQGHFSPCAWQICKPSKARFVCHCCINSYQ